MKEQLTINHMALGSLRTRRKQYLSLALGIVLAIFFVSAMIMMWQSLNDTMYQDYLRREGTQDAVIFDAEGIDPQELIDLGYAKRVGSVTVLGDAHMPDAPNADYNFGVGQLDEITASMGGRPLAKGRMPQASDEIAMEQETLRWIAPGAQIGDEITLTLKSLKGGNQFLEEMTERKYSLVGVLKDKNRNTLFYSTAYYLQIPTIIVADQPVEIGAKPAIHWAVELADNVPLSKLDEYVVAKLGLYSSSGNMQTYAYVSFMESNFQLAIVIGCLALVLVVAACLGIVNAFTSLLTERRSQIGMLRAVGATRKQIRHIFGREAFLIALFATPFAIGLALLAVRGLCKTSGLFDFYVTIPFLVICALVSLICVMLSALMPLWSASGIAPMQAIRETSLLRAKKKLRIKRQSQFDVPSLLARRHISLYRNKQAGITAIVAVSLVIFSLLFMMMDSITGVQAKQEAEPDYLLSKGYVINDFIDEEAKRPRLTESDRARIEQLPLVQQVAAERIVSINVVMNEITDYIFSPFDRVPSHYGYLLDPSDPRAMVDGSPEYINVIREKHRQLLEQQPQDGKLLLTTMMVCDESTLLGMAEYVYDGSIDIDAINRGEEVVVYAPPEQGFYASRRNGSEEIYPVYPQSADKSEKSAVNDMYFAGDLLRMNYLYLSTPREEEDYFSHEYDFTTDVVRWDGLPRIGAVISKENQSALWLNQGSVITTFAGLAAMGIPNNGYNSLSIYLSQTPSEEMAQYLYDELDNIAQYVPEMVVDDYITQAMDSRRTTMQLVVCGAAVIVLFFSICLSMVNNALTNRMRSEKRSIGTMRAVGASLDVIAASYFKQLLIMLCSGFGIGMLLSGVVIWLLATFANFTSHSLPIWILVGGELAFVALVLVASMLNLRSRLKGIMKSSIVDNIREL